ncbi:MAG: ring-hydroxylating oxygenase subunit alpha [Rhodospirillaceae bacterium]|nr:ring-hydroxylating oxygenase subunit alpha [Rhodospirillaceae bacterium]
MTSSAQNELMTRVGPGTPAGGILRSHWQPIALTDELPKTRSVRAVEVFGEKLVLFSNQNNELGLIGRHCAHRGADLCYGRLEDGGLRCPFHGWLFDINGQCIEQPAEPKDSELYKRIRQKAYPVREKNGVIFSYLGTGFPPDLPNLDCLIAPRNYSFAFKGLVECNWLQLLEVGIDPAHASFLHRFLEDEEDTEYGLQFRDNINNIPMTRLMRDYYRPEIKVEATDYGHRLVTLRNLDNQGMHVRVTNQVFPNAIHIPLSSEMTLTQWHVPIDDFRSYWYAMFTSFGEPVDQAIMRKQRLELYEMPDYIPKTGKANNYGFNAKEQKNETYTGMGYDINVHDQWAVESQGVIQDRTQETLGTSDAAILAYRKSLIRAIRNHNKDETGNTFPPSHKLPIAIDVIASMDDWEDAWKEADIERRKKSSWANSNIV